MQSLLEKRVGIGDVVVEQGDVVLSAYGVGSCVALAFYCATKKVGGLAHILLPFGEDHSTKYPKGAIAELLRQFGLFALAPGDIVAKIVGGATMFENFLKQAIGKRNVAETKEALKKHHIPVVAEDVLGNWGRSVFFNVRTGVVVVKSYKHGEKIL